MAKIILIGNQKGGVGKSTVITLLANCLSQEPFNYKVTVIDTDKQKSLVKLRLLDSEDFADKLPYDILNYNVSTFEAEVKRLDKENDFIFIDTGGKLSTAENSDSMQERILNYVNYLFIPFVGGNFSLDATIGYLKFAIRFNNESRKKRPFQTVGFINRFRERSRNNSFLLSEIDQLKKVVDIPFMRNKLNDYVLFSEINTTEKLYHPDSSEPSEINAVNFINEFLKKVK